MTSPTSFGPRSDRVGRQTCAPVRRPAFPLYSIFLVAQLTAYATVQEGGNISSRGETAKQRVLRGALRNDHMRPIAEVATQTLRAVPEFHAFVMPATNATSAQLVAHATAMADAALAHERVFTDVGLPDDFIADLRALAGEVAKSIDDRSTAAGGHSNDQVDDSARSHGTG